MSEFERTKENVAGHSILMTSWFDDVKQVWHASAPAYAHLGAINAAAAHNCASRKAAVAHVTSQLADHFEKSKY